jgi:hypothetical protein
MNGSLVFVMNNPDGWFPYNKPFIRVRKPAASEKVVGNF